MKIKLKIKQFLTAAQATAALTAAGVFNVPVATFQEITAASRAARYGLNALVLGEVLSSGLMVLRPLLALAAMVAVTAINAVAQSPIITPSAGQFGQTIVKIIQVIFGLIFLGGFIFLAKAVISYFKKDGFAYDLIGAGICFGINILAYLVYALSKGQTIEIDGSALGGN